MYRLIVVAISIFYLIETAYPIDTLLCTVPLTKELGKLRSISGHPGSDEILSGPVIMENNDLLFYSSNGYLLCSSSGFPLDSDFVNSLIEKSNPLLKVLIPLDRKSLLYVDKSTKGYERKILFRKKLKHFTPLGISEDLTLDGQLFNIGFSALTNDIHRKILCTPFCLGYDSDKKVKWWSIYNLNLFTIPCIVETNGKFISNFAGVKKSKICRSVNGIEYLRSYQRNGSWYYLGIRSFVGTNPGTYNQYIYLCNESGSVLRVDTLKKMVIDSLSISITGRKNINEGSISEFCFQPSIDDSGALYYGSIDYNNCEINIKKRVYAYYESRLEEPDVTTLDQLDNEVNYSYELLDATQSVRRYSSPSIPEVRIKVSKNYSRVAYTTDLQKDGYIVRLLRRPARDYTGKIGHVKANIPGSIQRLQDSISTLSTSEYPYGLSISNAVKGIVGTYMYGPTDEVIGARVVGVDDSNVVIRTDLLDRAEIVVVTKSGKFVDRFIFNNQTYYKRKDVISVSQTGQIFERDYESSIFNYHHFVWDLNNKQLPIPRVDVQKKVHQSIPLFSENSL